MSSAAAMPSSRRSALIVATGHYEDPELRELRATGVDANRLAAVLGHEAIGRFDVDVAIDEDEGTLTRRIARFFGAARRNDELLLHIACHGVNDERNRLFLAAHDTEMALLDASAISAEWLEDQVASCRSRRIVLLLDCCFSGRFPFNATARAGDSVHVQEKLQGKGRAVITATTATEYAYEGDRRTGAGHESYFTSAIVEGLETGAADLDHDGLVSVDDLYQFVYDRVTERSAHQRPSQQGALEGPLYVARARPGRATGKAFHRIEHAKRRRVLALAFSPDGERLATADSRLARVWDMRDAAEVSRVVVNHDASARVCASAAGIAGLAFGAEGAHLYALRARGEVEKWSVEDGAHVETRRGAPRVLPALAAVLSEDGPTLAVAGARGRAAVFDLAGGRRWRVGLSWLPVPLSAMALLPRAKLLAAGDYRSKVHVWSLEEERRLLRLDHPGIARSLAFATDGRRLATAGRDRTAHIWDVADGAKVMDLTHGARVRTVAFRRDGNALATASDDMITVVWDVTNGEELHRMTHEHPIRGLAFDLTGRWLATAGTDGMVSVWAMQ